MLPAAQVHQRTPSGASQSGLSGLGPTPMHSRNPSLLPASPTTSLKMGTSSSASPMKSVPVPATRERVLAFYRKYNAAKLPEVDNILRMYAGKENELMAALQAKYGPEETWWIPKVVQQPAAAVGGEQRSFHGQQVRPGTPTVVDQRVVPQQPPGQASFQQRLQAILSRFDPAKLHLIPQMIVAFKGNEENLIRGLERKYNIAAASAASTVCPPVEQTRVKPQQQTVQPPQSQLPFTAGRPSIQSASGSAPVSPAHHSNKEPGASAPKHREVLNPRLADLVVSDSDSSEESPVRQVPHAKHEEVPVAQQTQAPEAATASDSNQKVASAPSQPSNEQAADATQQHSVVQVQGKAPHAEATVTHDSHREKPVPTLPGTAHSEAAHPVPTHPAVAVAEHHQDPVRQPPESPKPKQQSGSGKLQWSGNVVQPLTERRNNDHSIVVAPVLVIGGRPSDHRAGADDGGRIESPTLSGSSAVAHHRSTASTHDEHEARGHHVTAIGLSIDAGGVGSDSYASSGRYLDKGPVQLQTHLDAAVASTRSITAPVMEVVARRGSASSERHHVSISPLSRSASTVHHHDRKLAVAVQSENVGCENTRRRVRSSSAPKRVGAEEKPLWVNPAAKGRLSTAYARGRDEASQDADVKNASAFADSILKVYRPQTKSSQDAPPATDNIRKRTPPPVRVSSPMRAAVLPADHYHHGAPVGRTSTTRCITPPRKHPGHHPISSTVVPSVSAPKSSVRQTATTTAQGGSSPMKRTAESRNTRPTSVADQSVLSTSSSVKPASGSKATDKHQSIATALDEIVLDLRKEFRPNISNPPPLDELFGVRRTTTPPNRRAISVRHSDASTVRNSNTNSATRKESPARQIRSGASTPRSHLGEVPTSQELRKHETSSSSAHHQRKVIEVENAPAVAPFSMYSSFGSATNTKNARPSAWAKAPTKIGIFDVSPKKRHHVIALDTHTGGVDLGLPHVEVDPVTGLTAIIKYDAFGHRLKLIRDAPADPEAVEAQKRLNQRLSAPRPIYVRKSEH